MNSHTLQQLTIITTKNVGDDISNWLQIKGAISITIIDAGDEPIYEPPLDSIILWEEIKITSLFDNAINIENLINQLNYDFSSDVILKYEHTPLTYNPTIEKCDFEPVCFSNRLWLYPYDTFPEKNQADRYYINLEPGLAFGSGEHPTTSLCLEWLASNIMPNQKCTIIDYGSGSGILSLAAVKLGAVKAMAVDNDPQAIMATNENAKRNNIATQVEAFFPDELPAIEADYIVANILANPLISLAPTLISHLKHSGKLILSGILKEQTDEVALTYMNYGISIKEITSKGAWVRIIGEK